MANIKFSQFTVGNTESDIDFVVGYKGANNIQISPTNLLAASLSGYLPLTGGTMIGNVIFNDGVKAKFGTSGDLEISHNGNASIIDNLTGTLFIRNFADDEDIRFECDNGSGGVTTYFKLDGSNVNVSVARDFLFQDNVIALFGNASDLRIYHNGTNNLIDSINGDISIRQLANDKDIRFRCDDGSGGETDYFFLDGSRADGTYVYTEFPDNSVIGLGNDTDLQIYHSGTNSLIDNFVGDLIIQQKADDKDIIFKSDNGSGGTATYFFLDGSNSHTNFQLNARWVDNSKAQFGNSGDMELYHDGSHSYVKQGGTGDLYIQQFRDDGNIIFQSDDGSGGMTTYFELDGNSVLNKFRQNLYLLDNVGLKIGNSFDLDIKHDGSDSYIQNSTGDLYIRNFSDNKDIVFQSDNGSGGVATYFRLDGSQADGTYRYIDFPDNSVISLGDNDAAIFHDATDTRIKNETGDLFISQFANDKDINFRNDDGSGGIATYFRIDGATVQNQFLKSTLHFDNVEARFGDSADLRIYHDGSDSYIRDSGTGVLALLGSEIRIQNVAGNENTAKFIPDGAVELYYDNSKRFETTSDGATILGGTGVDTLSRLRVGGEGTGNNKSILELVEHTQGTDMHYGFSFTCDGDGSNNLLLRRHQNSVTGAIVMTVNRSDDNVTFAGNLKIQGISEYADNTAAIAAGLTTGQLYRTGDLLKIVH